ncbi:MAG: lipid-A-disaccharide synthase [Pseudomonadales bacterium]|nr:lipid-A-disaccharide synthase [Pseudomonadales bacterium]
MSDDGTLIVGIVAGETSGDNLGAALMSAMQKQQPRLEFVGIGGPAMTENGLRSWIDIDRLAVNGFVEPLKRLPELIKILRSTRNKIIAAKVSCFIGVDFNFFNLLLAGMLKKAGIPTVHYVSPTVWAWRKGRIRSIAKKVDLMLTLYPFELDIYHANHIQAVFVGHPKADQIQPNDGPKGKKQARDKYQISHDVRLVAMLPGSRSSEVSYSGSDFIAAAKIIRDTQPAAEFILPAVNPKRQQQIEDLLQQSDLKAEDKSAYRVVPGDAQTVMMAADVVLVNSGTATLEAMLLKKPMVMSYRLGTMTYWVISRLVTTKYFALPNILANKALVPELIQYEATPEALAAEVLKLLEDEASTALNGEFDRIHRSLQKNSAQVAAAAVFELLSR